LPSRRRSGASPRAGAPCWAWNSPSPPRHRHVRRETKNASVAPRGLPTGSAPFGGERSVSRGTTPIRLPHGGRPHSLRANGRTRAGLLAFCRRTPRRPSAAISARGSQPVASRLCQGSAAYSSCSTSSGYHSSTRARARQLNILPDASLARSPHDPSIVSGPTRVLPSGRGADGFPATTAQSAAPLLTIAASASFMPERSGAAPGARYVPSHCGPVRRAFLRRRGAPADRRRGW